MAEAYKRTHPNCTDESARKNAGRFFSNEAIEKELDRVLDVTKPMQVSRDNIVKLLGMVISKWLRGDEKTSDFLRTLELMSKLVPDFVDRTALTEYDGMEDSELTKQIQERYRTAFGKDVPSES